MLPVHELSAVNGHSLRLKYRATLGLRLDAPRESSWRPCAENLFPSRSFLAIGQTVGSLWLHLVLGQFIQEIFSPVPHRIDDRLQGLAALGNGIFHLRWNLSVDLARDYAVFL